MKYVAVFLTIIALLSGCTSKELYNATQQNRVSDCNTKAPAERDACLEALNDMTYEEYQKQRERIIKK